MSEFGQNAGVKGSILRGVVEARVIEESNLRDRIFSLHPETVMNSFADSLSFTINVQMSFIIKGFIIKVKRIKRTSNL